MITLVMGQQQAVGGDSLALQVSSTVPAGDTTLRAVATLARPPGQEVAVWTVDGERAGTSTWTLVRRLADGRSVWQTALTVSLAEGSYVVTVALRSMVDGASVTAIPTGGGTPLSYELKLSSQQSYSPFTMPSGDAVSTSLDSVSVSGSGTLVANVRVYGAAAPFPDLAPPAWYVTGTISPTASQFGFWAAGHALFMRFDSCPAGSLDIEARVSGNSIGTVTVTVT